MPDKLRESHELLDTLEGTELVAMHALLTATVAKQAERAERIRDCLETVRTLDEVDQLAIMAVVKGYIQNAVESYGDEPEEFWFSKWVVKCLPKKHADGVYVMSDGVIPKEALLNTQDFSDYRNFQEMASSFELKGFYGEKVAAFLYEWAASRQPDSFAAQYIAKHATRTGKLTFTPKVYDRNFFRVHEILFHRSILKEYVEEECFEGEQHRAIINPIVSLLVTDDWEFAVSQLSNAQRRKL